MSSPVIDLDALLAPISEDAPAGTDPRSDTSANSLYYRIKDARNAARAAERAEIEPGSQPPEEWRTVITTAEEILSQHAKDLEVAAWLTEGLVRRHGFRGLRDGLSIITAIVASYWDTCFPELDEDGIEGRIGTVAVLNGTNGQGTLIQPLRLTPIVEGGSEQCYSLWHYEQALELDRTSDIARKQERIEAGALSMEAFVQSVAETPADFFSDLVDVLQTCLTRLEEMSEAIDTIAGPQALSISALRELLEKTAGCIRHLAAKKLDASPSVSREMQDGKNEEAGATTSDTARTPSTYASREEALAELARIAGYFRTNEPQSPISYTLEEAVRRARMPLPDLLFELAGDTADIRPILLAAGIQPRDTEAAL